MAETWLKSCLKVPHPNPLSRLDQYAATSGVPNGSDPYGNQMLGVVNHSSEGYFGTGNDPISVMNARGNSWHITIYRSGKKEQHFPLQGMCWASGRKSNYRHIQIEHEGVAGQPLTAAQLAATIEVQAEICRIRGWTSIKKNVTGWEHNQFMATSCPSGRIPWAKIEVGTRAASGIWGDVKPVSKNVTLYRDTNLVELPGLIFIKKLSKGTSIAVGGQYKSSHYISKWSMDNRKPNGFAISATIPPPSDPCEAEKQRIAELQTQVTKLSSQVKSLQTANASLTSQLQVVRTQLAEVQGRLAQEKALTAQLRLQNANLIADKTRLFEELSKANIKITNLEAEIVALKEEETEAEETAGILTAFVRLIKKIWGSEEP